MTFKCFIYTSNIAHINQSDALKYELFCYDLKCFISFYIFVSSYVLTERILVKILFPKSNIHIA